MAENRFKSLKTKRTPDAPGEVAETAAAPAPESKPRPSKPRVAPVRTTLDLSPVENKNLRDICNEAADNLGKAKIDRVAYCRALIAEAHESKDLRARIEARLAEGR